MLSISMSSYSMSYEQARREALFLTDKMAYELNLNQYQYDAAYEINLDYLMGVTSVDDVYGNYWTRRNLDMSYILFDWQWTAYQAATYFFRPLYFSAGNWHFGIYARYPHRSHFYFDRPSVYISYRGGHGMHHHRDSYYHSHRNHYRPSGTHIGMRDNHKRKHDNGRHDNNRGHVREFRVTGTHNQGSFGNRNDGGNRNHGSMSNRNNGDNSNQGFVNNKNNGGNRHQGSFNKSNKNNSSVTSRPSSSSSNRGGSFSNRSNNDRRPSSVSSSSSNRRPSSVSSSSSNRRPSSINSGSSNRRPSSVSSSSNRRPSGGATRGNNGGDSNRGGSFGGRR